jgi:tetratricopeptide (TPR) repeat protein
VKRKQLTPTLRDYHNLHWLIYAALQQGRHARAGQLVDDFMRMRARNELANYSARYINSALAAYVIETRRWDQADVLFGGVAPTGGEDSVGARAASATAVAPELCGTAPIVEPKSNPKAARPASVASSSTDTPTFIRAFSAAMSRGDAGIQADGKRTSGTGSFPKLRQLQLTGLAQAHAKNFPAALDALREAAAMEGKTSRSPGPPVEKPAHELLGEVLLRAGDPKGALAEFKIALDRHPNRALSLLGRARAEAAAGDKAAARSTYARLLEIWQQADADLPELQEARHFVSASSAFASHD